MLFINKFTNVSIATDEEVALTTAVIINMHSSTKLHIHMYMRMYIPIQKVAHEYFFFFRIK